MEQEIAEAVRDKLRLNNYADTLEIRRVPKATIRDFKELAHSEQFCGDYGFTLKFLMDFYNGALAKGNEYLEAEIIVIKEEIDKINKSLASTTEVKSEEPKRNRLG